MRRIMTRVLLATTIVAAASLAPESVAAVDDAPPPSTEGAGEGEGYGGTSDWLLVEVSEGRVHLRGGGFRAESDVEVEVGNRFSTVRADELGNVDVWLEVEGDELVIARGVAADGSSRVVVPSSTSDSGTSSLQTLFALAAGALGAWALLRESRRARVVPSRIARLNALRRPGRPVQLPRP